VTRNYIARSQMARLIVPNANDGGVRSIIVQADGKILVGGFFTAHANGGRRSRATASPGSPGRHDDSLDGREPRL
jgi:hypothetical protein